MTMPTPRRYWWLAVALLAAALAGCQWNAPISIDMPAEVHRPDRPIVVFFADGVAHDVLTRMAAAGELPNIQRHLFARGTQVDNAVTVVPSITFAANASLMTGQFPGHHGITGNRWFDRDTLRRKSYEGISSYQEVIHDFIKPTFFEMAPDLHSVTVLTPVHRGSTQHFTNWLSAGVTWFFSGVDDVDALTVYRMNQIGQTARQACHWPDVIWLYFPGPDHIAHEYGKDSPDYREIMANLDRQIGRAICGLQQAGVYDRTMLVLVTDHGHRVVDPCRRAMLVDRLCELGFAVADCERVDGDYTQRLRAIGPMRVVATDDGNRRAALHLRVGDRWRDRPTLAQIERFHRDFGGPAVCKDPAPFWNVLLAQLPPRKLAAVRDGPDHVLLTDGVGQAVVERQALGNRNLASDNAASSFDASGQGAGACRRDHYRYIVTAGPDPLRLADHVPARPLLDGQFHPGQKWLDATCESDTPDIVAQIVDYFDSNRSGDVLLFSMDAWQFTVCNPGGHGSVTRHDMHIPMVFAGPGVPAGGHIRTARIVDLVPTLLDYLGRLDSRRNCCAMDGVSRWSQIQAAATQPN